MKRHAISLSRRRVCNQRFARPAPGSSRSYASYAGPLVLALAPHFPTANGACTSR